jgi:hypothetical protein
LQQEFKTLFGGDKAVTKRMKLDIEIILSNLTIRGIKKTTVKMIAELIWANFTLRNLLKFQAF